MRKLLFAAACLALLGCGDDDGDDQTEYTVSFQALVDGTDFACGDSYTLGTADTEVTITDFRFFVSSVSVIDSQGNLFPMMLTDDDVWQTDEVALLDFENAANGCDGTVDTNTSIVGTAGTEDAAGIVFDLGLPFEANHGLAADAEPPLNTTGLQWNWQGGYKYIRVDTDNGDGEWSLHIGANGCESADMMSPPDSECANPNRARITLAAFDPSTQAVALDFGTAVATSDISTPAEPPPGCLSFANAETKCTAVFEQLGMSFSGGGCENDCAAQTVFTAAAR
ncbi:MAG: metallo-mystery pair system four-Cys motif protein [Deltaproteobacteria bacterium]|nr:metallo-mystery pair system four-Cys motif protein [Deltaproteobacteria bacterium]